MWRIYAYVPSFDNTLAIYEYNTCHIVGMYNHLHIYDKVILSKKIQVSQLCELELRPPVGIKYSGRKCERFSNELPLFYSKGLE